jgi:ATP/ADP translocase
MNSVLFVVGLTYPLWGLIVLPLVAWQIAKQSKTSHKAMRFIRVFLTCSLVFTPVGWGSAGIFVIIAPWWLAMSMGKEGKIVEEYSNVTLWGLALILALSAATSLSANTDKAKEAPSE